MFQMSVISVSFVLISAQLNLLFTCLLYSPQNAERDALERRRTPRMESYGVLSSRSLLIISCLGSRVYRLFISLRRRHGENREVRSEKREPSPKNQDLTKVSLKRGKTRSQQYVVQGAKSSWGHTIYGHTYTEAYIIWQIYVYGICHMGFYDSSMSKCAAQANTWESLLLLRLAVVNAPSSSHPLPLRTPLQLSSCGSFRPLTLGQITAQFGNSSCLLA